LQAAALRVAAGKVRKEPRQAPYLMQLRHSPFTS
jgi:hypothetical protein